MSPKFSLKEAIEKTKNFIFARQHAYLQTFNPEDVLALKVIKDLAKFCRANETCFHSDPRVQGMLEGRREVWIRIQHHIKLDQEQLWKVYGRTDIE